MKKIKLLLTTMSGVCIATLPLIAAQCSHDKQNNDQGKEPESNKQPNPGTSETQPNPGTSETQPNPGTSETQPNPGTSGDKEPTVTANKDFLALDNDALVTKYIKHAPTLKEEIVNQKTAWMAETSDLKDVETKPSDTETVSVVSITMPKDNTRYEHLEDWLKQGKMKVDYRFKVASKVDPAVQKEFTKSYEISGYISEAKAKEIFAQSMSLLDDSNFSIDKTKLIIDIDSSRPEFKGTNNSYKFLNGSYYPLSVEKAISIKNQGAIAKASYQFNKLGVNPAKNELRIEPFLYLDNKSANNFFVYRNGKEYVEGDNNTSIVFDNLPSRALSAVAIATNYRINQAFNFDKAKLEKATGKVLSETDPKDVTVEMLNQALDINHTEVVSSANNALDKFMVSSEFIKNSKLHITEVKANEREGSIVVKFEFNTIPLQDPNGTIYLGKGIEQSQDPQQLNIGTFTVKKSGFKALGAAQETEYQEKAIFELEAGMTFEKIKELWDNKKDKFESKGGAIQKYGSGKKAFLGITANGQGKNNKILTLKQDSEMNIDSVLSTNIKGGKKYLEASLNEATKQLIVKYKLASEPEKYYKQTITLA
ncbi:hypothetical protein [Mycoplasma sp. 005V]|uniref:hypothetical protein n=1 Tax=unclassified Mycoplasma TaxID=2683645 RepID=UPI003A8C3E36